MVAAINSLNDLKDKEMPVALAYKIVTSINKLMEKYTIYEQTLNGLKTDKEKLELFDLITEIEITPFLMSEFSDANIKLTPAQMFGIQVLIDE